MVRNTHKRTWAIGRQPAMAYLSLAAASSAQALIDVALGLLPSPTAQMPVPARARRQHPRSRVLSSISAMTQHGDTPPRDPDTAEYLTRVWLRSAALFQTTPNRLLRAAKVSGDLGAMERLLFVDERSLDDPSLRHRLAQIRERGPIALKSRMTNALIGRGTTLPTPTVVLARIAAFVIAISAEVSRRFPSAGKPLTQGDMHGAFLAALRDEPSSTVDAALPARGDAWRQAVKREREAAGPLARAAMSYFRRTKVTL